MTDNEWDAFAAEWDTNEDAHSYSEKAFESLTNKVLPLLSNLPKSRVLDFGCGTGLLTEKLAAHCGQVVAVDTSATMIEVLKRKVLQAGTENIVGLNIAVDAATTMDNPVLSKKFDLIVASSVCSFLPDYEATLLDLAVIMNTDAYFVQWDWLADMPMPRIRNALKTSGLVEQYVDQVFAMKSNGDSMPVVMGIGKLKSPS
ncbi:MAG: 2-polyprenyl-3-methyl-5-hydroxy-6-metoxy-1,4-benzoquinol methylase [Woeseiaceae bacterium]|jgi:2-polyprenyl-3-methyl-5-hydroxy-6-metoxy-1,4-benzoquinol methylase